MGFLIIVGTAIFTAVSIILSFETVKSEIGVKNQVYEYTKIDTSSFYAKNLPVQRVKPEEIETFLIRACQTAQSMIIKCQQCYMEGNLWCPYPTNSFCWSARGVNPNDTALMWSFLPNNSGQLTEVLSASDRDVNTLTDVAQLGEGIRWLIKRQVSADFFDGYRYAKPSGWSADACAVEGVVVQ